jgi:hypothetical protein
VNRARLIRDSIAAPRMALLGWIPIFGLPFWLLALRFVSNSGRQPKGHWNPARARCIWASVLLFPGLFIQLASGLALGSQLIRDRYGHVPGFVFELLDGLLS